MKQGPDLVIVYLTMEVVSTPVIVYETWM